MKTHIAFGTESAPHLGTAVAGTLLYGHGASSTFAELDTARRVALHRSSVSPATIDDVEGHRELRRLPVRRNAPI